MGILDWRTFAEARAEFSWDAVWDVFDGNRAEFNVAHECIDRHVGKGVAVRIKFADGATSEHTFAEIARLSSQFANALGAAGVGKGDRVAIMLDPSLEYYTALFGTIKRGAIAVPFYPQFGPEAVDFRLRDSSPQIAVTAEEHAALFDTSMVQQVVTSGAGFQQFVGEQPEELVETVHTAGNDVAVYQYTSGTTRKFPEVIRHFHKSVPVLIPTAVFCLGLRPGDRYFCPSPPSWGHGLWYGTFAPLALGIPVGTYSGRFEVEALLDGLEQFQINNLSAAPTLYRRLKNSSDLGQRRLCLDKLSYSMEPMDSDTFEFLERSFGARPCSFYGSTETGVVIMNYNGFEDFDVKQGALGKPCLGVEVAVIDVTDQPVAAGELGEIAVRRKGEWFRVKDAGVCDADGYFWHKGRSDDVIISSGWTISPTEVEDCLQKHPAVEEAVVVGAPDADRGHRVTAYIAVNREESQGLLGEVRDFVRSRLSKHEYPRDIVFVPEIPKSTGGKIDRKAVKAWANEARL